jgi:hypothetical protein
LFDYVAGFIEGNRSHIFIQIISQIKKSLATSPSVSQGLFGISIRLEKPSWWFFFSHNIAAWDPMGLRGGVCSTLHRRHDECLVYMGGVLHSPRFTPHFDGW